MRGFVPLGDFLVDHDDAPEVSPEQAAGYIERLRTQHADIEPFVAHGLGWRAPKKKKSPRPPRPPRLPETPETPETPAATLGARRGRPPPRSTVGVAHPQPVAAAAAGAEALAAAEDAEDADASRGGRVVWVPVVVGRSGGSGASARTSCYWPGLCLHMDDDRDLIPESAVAALRPDHAPDTHRLAVYFGDKTFEWRRADELLEYADHADDIVATQAHLRHRVRYRRALEEAEEWWRRQRRARETPAARERPRRENRRRGRNSESRRRRRRRRRTRRARADAVGRVACVAPPRSPRRNFRSPRDISRARARNRPRWRLCAAFESRSGARRST